jgi:hypothetical protein
MRPILFPLLLCTTSTALAIDIDAQEERIAEAERRSADCSADGLHALFALAASDEIDGVDPSEQLSEVNEIAFFRCPGPFLTQLDAEPDATQIVVVRNYFGIMHAREEIARVLRTFLDDPKLAPFVRKRFAEYLTDV